MLQNNGPFGPNQVSVNPSTNVNNMSGQNTSVGNNINNLNKISQPLPHPTNAFHLPDYVNYGLNMNPFHNFHQVSFQQNLMSQNTLQDSWQQNPLPMNLNTQNEHFAHGYYDKKLESQSNVSQSYSRNMLNIPQVHPKQYKHFGMESYPHFNNGINSFNQYFDPNLDLRLKLQRQPQTRQDPDVSLEVSRIEKPVDNFKQIYLSNKVQKTCQELPKAYEARNFIATQPHDHGNLDLSYKQHYTGSISEKSDSIVENCHFNKVSNAIIKEKISNRDQNLDLSTKYQKPEQNSIDGMDKLPMDQVRRRNLANTVKMIEDILNQTTIARQKEIEDQQSKSIVDNIDKATTAVEASESTKDNKVDDNSKLSDKSLDDSNSKIEPIFQSDDDASNISTSGSAASQQKGSINTEKSHNNLIATIKTELPTDSDSSEEDDDEINDKDIIEKIEISPDLHHYIDPFTKDTFGIQKADIEGCKVHDSEQSVNNAKEAVRNGTSSNLEYYECLYCNLCFNHPKRFLVHVKWHSFGLTNEKREEMHRAKEKRKQMQKEARALEKIRKDEVTDAEGVVSKNYNCKYCDKVFCKKSSLKNHKHRYHSNKSRECKICGKVFVGWVALRDHHHTHVVESGYQCADCPKRFKYSHSLAKHRDTHLEKTHACPQCPKMFGSAALLNVHSKTHERMRRGATFRCTYCGKGFFEAYHLQAHERTHRNERPFVCEICKTSFVTNSGLKRHLKVSHSTSKPFECSICHRSFISEAIRDRHEMRNHGDPEDFKFICKQCPCRYLKQKDLRKHVYKVHPKGKRKKKSQSESE